MKTNPTPPDVVYIGNDSKFVNGFVFAHEHKHELDVDTAYYRNVWYSPDEVTQAGWYICEVRSWLDVAGPAYGAAPFTGDEWVGIDQKAILRCQPIRGPE